MDRCAYCEGVARKKCSKCGGPGYCDRACQRKDLRNHREACAVALAAPTASSASARAAPSGQPQKKQIVMFSVEGESSSGVVRVLDQSFIIVAEPGAGHNRAMDAARSAAIDNALRQDPEISGAATPDIFSASTVAAAAALGPSPPIPDTWLAIDPGLPGFAEELAQARARWPEAVTEARVAAARESSEPFVCNLVPPCVTRKNPAGKPGR